MRKTPDVQCTIRMIVAGRCVKTVRRDCSMKVAMREIGGDPLNTEGRLMTGQPWRRSRTVAHTIRLEITYVGHHEPVRGVVCKHPIGIHEMPKIVRARMAL